MSYLEPSVIKVLCEFIRAGVPQRKIAEHLQISRMTVQRHRARIVANEEMPACGCGRKWRHSGWCRERFLEDGMTYPSMAGRRGVKISRRRRIEPSVIEVMCEFLADQTRTTSSISQHLEVGLTVVLEQMRKMRAGGDMPDCPCGREWRHRGWCKPRLVVVEKGSRMSKWQTYKVEAGS